MSTQREIRDVLYRILGLYGVTIPKYGIGTVTDVDYIKNTCEVLNDNGVNYTIKLTLNNGNGLQRIPEIGTSLLYLDFGVDNKFYLDSEDLSEVRLDVRLNAFLPVTFDATVRQGDGLLEGVPISGNIAEQMNILINAITLISTQLKFLGQPGVPPLNTVNSSTFANKDFLQGKSNGL